MGKYYLNKSPGLQYENALDTDFPLFFIFSFREQELFGTL